VAEKCGGMEMELSVTCTLWPRKMMSLKVGDAMLLLLFPTRFSGMSIADKVFVLAAEGAHIRHLINHMHPISLFSINTVISIQ
jgi:hypothetical protein